MRGITPTGREIEGHLGCWRADECMLDFPCFKDYGRGVTGQA